MDLLVEGPDGYTVIDYKTDAMSNDGDLDAAIDHYRGQAAGYALAIEQTLGRPIVRCVFLFLRPSRCCRPRDHRSSRRQDRGVTPC